MTVAELIELLSDMPEDADVRLATQPNWPLAAELGTVTGPAGEGDLDEAVVWLAAGRDLGYAPAAAWWGSR